MPCVLTCSRAYVPCMLTCSRAYVPSVLTCSRAYVPCVLTRSRAYVPCVLTCSRFYVPCMLTCSHNHVLMPCVLTCQRALRGLRAYVLTCYNTNDCSLFFSCEIKAFGNFCRMKWFDFCLSITLRVTFKWLIKGERWIIIYGS